MAQINVLLDDEIYNDLKMHCIKKKTTVSDFVRDNVKKELNKK